MNVDQFDYALPQELIAQTPLQHRSASRLLRCKKDQESFIDLQFVDLPTLLKPNDLLVLNDTKVIPARMFGQKITGGKVEFLLEKILDENTALAQLKASKSVKPGGKIIFNEQVCATVKDRQDEFFILEFENIKVEKVLQELGVTPLPPYIERSADSQDEARYQTVYAKNAGAVAAPTAGLHFDQKLINTLKGQGVKIASLTLHVGAGTFQPVRTGNILEHKIHAERMSVSKDVSDEVIRCKNNNGRVIAVGTTSVRALETAAQSGTITPYEGESELFIYPGFKFNVVDVLITNFHLPKSTLLMLVSAFAGMETIRAAYQHAVQNNYRFYSYGDAMIIEETAA